MGFGANNRTSGRVHQGRCGNTLARREDLGALSPRDSEADFLAHGGVPTFFDEKHAIAHNKIIIIDEATVTTGSFNFTRAAEERNAENLLVIRDPKMASSFLKNWRKHRAHADAYTGRGILDFRKRKILVVANMSNSSKPLKVVPITVELSNSADTYGTGLNKYLKQLGLPCDGILVSVKEQKKVIQTLPDVVGELEAGLKGGSYYLSKFVAAVGAGLFDAALNFVWDETVLQLGKKIAQFDMEYFINSTVADPERRKKFTSQEDLAQLDDWELIRGAHLTGILSDLGFKHLDYIRNMRNWASAAHPNQNQITGLQLVSWLETCIKEVIGKEPSGPAIEAKRLLHNIREQTLSAADVAPVVAGLSKLTPDVALSVLRTIFGMFCDPKIAVPVKQNIRLISKAIWKVANEEAKREVGLKYGTFAANADVGRRDAAKEFLGMVDGLAYLPPDTLASEMAEKVQNLFMAHTGWNNFYNEPAHAKALMSYISETGTVPEAVRYQYVKTVTMCSIGNGHGVSGAANPYYEQMLALFTDNEIWTVALMVTDSDVTSRLAFADCRKRFRRLLAYFRARTSNTGIIAVIDHIQRATDEQLPLIGAATQTRRLLGL